MLDEYKNIQPIVYKILKNAINKDKYSHAYLFETGGFYDSFNLIFSFVKAIECPNKYTNKENCGNCHICDIIESGNFPEIKIINPDGMWIKKGELQELQEEFNKKAVVGNKKIYIINGAEKLNQSAANSILKFLEEPEEGIIAILITENIYGVLETIRSRCQIIKFKEEKKSFSNESTIQRLAFLLNREEELTEEIQTKIEKSINFINYYEKNHLSTIIYMQKLWHDYIKTKDDLLNSFDIMTMYYKDILNYLTNHEIEIFINYKNEIQSIASKNTLKTISNKLTTLTDFKEKIRFNANTNLLMDKLIIEMEGGI